MVAHTGGYFGTECQGFRGGYTAGTSVPHHIQFGGGSSSLKLVSDGGIEIGRAGRAWTGGTATKRPLSLG